MEEGQGDDRAVQGAQRTAAAAGTRKGQVAFQPIFSSSGAVVPVSFDTLVWRYQKSLGLSIIVKASFSFADGPMRPRNPEPIYTRDTAWADGSSIRAPSDMVPRRPRVGVSVAGRVHAAEGRGQQRVSVRLALIQGGLVQFDCSRELEAGTMSPFAARSGLDESRRSLLGASPQLDPNGVLEVPGNLPWAYYQAAPPEQCVDALKGDALMVVEGMHPKHPQIRATLPDVWAVGSIFGLDERAPNKGNTLTMRADTVVLDTERLICSIVWRAELGLASEQMVSQLTAAAGVAITGQPIQAPAQLPGGSTTTKPPPRRPLPPRKPAKSASEEVVADIEIGPEDLIEEPLPFEPAKPGTVPAAVVRVEQLAPHPWAGTTLATSGDDDAEPLPFMEVVAAADAPPPAPPAPGAAAALPTPAAPHQRPAAPKSPAATAASGIAAWGASLTQPKEKPAAKVTPPKPLGETMYTPETEVVTGVLDAAEVDPSETLPFKKREDDDAGKIKMPSAARWAALVGAAEKGGTASIKGAVEQAEPLPFADGQRQAKNEAAPALREAEQARIKAEVEAQREKEAAEKAERERLAEKKRLRDEAEAARRAEEERRQFEEGQRLLREKEAKRKAEEQKRSVDKAKELEDGLYGSFDD